MNPELYSSGMSLHLFTNPYVLGYLAVIVLLWRAGTGLKHMAQQNVEPRKRKLD